MFYTNMSHWNTDEAVEIPILKVNFPLNCGAVLCRVSEKHIYIVFSLTRASIMIYVDNTLFYVSVYVSDCSHVIVMTLMLCVYSLCGVGNLLMWPEAKKDSHPTSQIKAVIVSLTTTKANERQICYRNKHFGDTGGATLQ